MKHLIKHTAILMALIFCAFTMMAPTAQATEEGWYPKIVDYDFMNEHATIPVRDDVVVIDSRPQKRRFNKGHIPGAISIPNSSFDKMTDMLPAEKDKLIIFYCGGLKCMLSHKSAFKAEALGYTNIKVYAAGMPDWKDKGRLISVSAEYVKDVLDKDIATVIDARPAKRKYANGHVPGAINIPNSSFDKMTDMLPADKTSELIFYCGGMKCPLSVKSATKAIALGYNKTRVFQGGYPEWKKAFGEGVKGMEPMAAATGTAIEAGEDGDTITVASFIAILKDKPDSITLYDVRDPEEFAKGSIPGAMNMPVEDLEDEMDTMAFDKPIVFICATGARSGEAYDIVKMVKEDAKVYFLDAELTFHAEGKYEIAQH